MPHNPSQYTNRVVTTYDLILQCANKGLILQRDDGSFPPGSNYPYNEHETPVRSTAEWLRILTKGAQISGNPAFEEASNKAIDYLLTEEARPSGYTYHNRDVSGKDSCNGLVGQHWPIQGIAEAASVFDRDEARTAALEVFRLHPFDNELGLWERVEIDGQPLSIDRTLNHQILFAGAASRLASCSPVVRDRVERFLDRLADNMFVNSNGRIAHYIRPSMREVLRSVFRNRRHRALLRNEVAFNYYRRLETRQKKERGYHVTNLEGLVNLRKKFPSHEFWDGEPFQSALTFTHENEVELVRRRQLTHGSTLQGITLAKVRYRLEDAPVNTIAKLVAADLDKDPTNGPHPFRPLDVEETTALTFVSPLLDMPNFEITAG